MNATMSGSLEALKLSAALAAVAEVEDGMIVGIGTGTTAAFAIEALARRAMAGLHVTIVATSFASAKIAARAGLQVIDFDHLEAVDIGIDGADEIDACLNAIKGAGGALLREKIVAAAAGRMIVIVDATKEVAQLGAVALPVEALPFACGFVAREIENLGASANLRMAGANPYRTDQLNYIFDCHFGALDDPAHLAAQLSAVPGILGHGLFLEQIDVAYIGTANGVRRVSPTD